MDHAHIVAAIERRDSDEARRRIEESLRNGQADFERRFGTDPPDPAAQAGGGGTS
jgi:DNA-binding GntR family transcriptional regulator